MDKLTDYLTRWRLLAAAPLALLLYAGGGLVERGAVILVFLAASAGAVSPKHRETLGAIAAGLVVAAALSLAAHLLLDDFTYRYVWLYSAPGVAWHLKLANLWGGDQGTLLFLTALASLAALRLIRRAGWAGPGGLVLTALFALGATVWSPFIATAPVDLARLTSQGMNAHLLSPWMAFHPPLIFAAFIVFLAPGGAALEALGRGAGDWRLVAPTFMRAGWLILSAGLASGMWWAYEDLTFGQIWHWDPVQTSVFAVWALATAQLHCLRRYRPGGTFSTIHPLLALATGVAALVSMAVTRNTVLASSHRYVGDSSLILFVTAAVLLALAAVAALIASRRISRRHGASDESALLIRIAITGLCLAAVVASGYLAQAFFGAYFGLERPEALKPFFETLSRWSPPAELAELRRAFDQWDVDGYAVNRWLAPLVILLGLTGGHNFMPFRRHWRWLATVGVAGLALLAAFWWMPLETAFTGAGMTSSQTTAIFGWLDAAMVAGLYLAAAALLWVGFALRRHSGRQLARRYFLPVAMIHAGVVLAVISGATATVFDSYAQKMIEYPRDLGKPLLFPGGYSVTISIEEDGYTDAGAFQSVARVGWGLERDGEVVERREGHAIFRDDRPPVRGEQGPIRLMCEILDYRYARYVTDNSRIMHPFIHRGLWRDVQVWFPAVDYRAGLEGAPDPRPTRVPVVLKIYPMMTWLWAGLALALAGAAIIVWRGHRQSNS